MEKQQPAIGFIDKFLIGITAFMATIPIFCRRFRWMIIIVVIFMTGALGSGMQRLKLDDSMNSFFRDDDPSMNSYRLFRYLFGSDEFLVIMYEAPDGDIFSSKSLLAVKKLENSLNKRKDDQDSHLHRITRIRSIVSADYLEIKGDSLINRQFIGDRIPNNIQEVEMLRQQALAHRDYPGSIFSKDSKRATITIQTNYGSRIVEAKGSKEKEKDMEGLKDKAVFDFSTDEGKEQKMQNIGPKEDSGNQFESVSEINRRGYTYYNGIKIPEMEQPQMDAYSGFMAELKQLLQEQGWYNLSDNNGPEEGTEINMNYVMAGNPYLMDFFFTIIEQEVGVVIVLCVLLILTALALAFGSMAAMIWPTLIIIISVIWTIGLVAWLGIVMSMMIQIIVFLNLTIGIAASIHIISGYKLFLVQGCDTKEALSKALGKSGLAIMLAALTTMAGLYSLTIVPIVPIRNFALAATIGILFSFILTIILLPTFLTFWAPRLTAKARLLEESSQDERRNKIERLFQKILSVIGDINEKHARKIVVVFILIMVLSALGAWKVKVDTNFTKEIKPGYGLREAYDIFDEYFGGAMTMEILVDTGEQEGMKSPQILLAMRDLADRVTSQRADFVPRTFSLVQVAKEANRILTDGSLENYRIPEDPITLSQVLFMYDSADPDTRKLFVDDDWRTGRLSMQVYNRSSYEYEQFMNDVQQWTNEQFSELVQQNPKLRISLTGGVPLMMKMINFISIAQVKSFGLALLVVSLILLVVFGSIRFGILAMIPNLFPLAIVTGIVGWAEIALDTDTLLVMPIAIGIAVDDTIHFLTRYRTEISHGMGRLESIRLSLKEVGQAMMFTSLILTIGFLVFVFSAYIPLTKFGVLSAVAIFSALIADLFFLPSLLLVFKPFKRKGVMDRGID